MSYYSDADSEVESLRKALEVANAKIERLLKEIDCLRPTGRSAVYDDYVATVPIVGEFWKHGTLEARVRAMAEDRQRLQAIVYEVRSSGIEVVIAGENWIAVPRAVWMKTTEQARTDK